MRVKCILCDYIDNIENESPTAKRLRNRPIHTYLCKPCTDRISDKTKARLETGNFRLYRDKKMEDDW